MVHNCHDHCYNATLHSKRGNRPAIRTHPEESLPEQRVTHPRFAAALLAAALAPIATVSLTPGDARTTGAWVLSFGVGAALGLVVLTWRTEWKRVGQWSALVMVGQGAALSWVDAGPEIHYQHLRFPEAGPSMVQWLALAVLFVQCGALLTGARPTLAKAWRFVGEKGSRLGWTMLAGAFLLTGAALSREPLFYATELLGAGVLQAVAFATVLAAAMSLTADQASHVRTQFIRLLEHRRLPWIVASWVFVASAGLAWAVYQNHPHVPDEVVYLLHARYFAAGLLDLPLPPVPGAFELDLVSVGASRWFVPVPPGWPAALALGIWAGIPWLVNPLFGALSVLLLYPVIRDLYGVRTAGATTCLLGTSPWFVFLNMSLMTHSFTLFALAGAAFATSRRVHGGRWVWSVAAGIGIGAIALNRPLEGLIVAAVLGLWALVRGRRRIISVGTMAVVSAAVVATTFPYNERLTGDPLTFPIMAYMDQTYGEGSNALGFGPEKGVGFGGLDPFPGHGPADAAVNSALNLFQINTELSGWSIGSILPIGLLLLVAGGLAAADLAMVGSILLVVGAHAFYWFSGGPDFGARYWYLTLIPLLVLVVRSGARLAHLTGEQGRVAFGAALLCAASLTVFSPWRATDKYWHYRGMEPGILELAEEHAWSSEDVVLVSGDRHPDYASAAVYNPLDLRGDGPIYTWSKGTDVEAALRAAYPGRRFWRVDGPTVSGHGFVVRAGPTELNPMRD